MEKETVIVVDGGGPEYATLSKALIAKGLEVISDDQARATEKAIPPRPGPAGMIDEVSYERGMRNVTETRKDGKAIITTRVGKYTTNPHAKNPLKELKRMVSPRQLKKAEKKMARAEREVLARAAQNPGSDA